MIHEHVWLWPHNWERYCLTCGLLDVCPSGAIGMVREDSWAPSSFGETLARARTQTVVERGIAPLVIQSTLTYVEALRSVLGAAFAYPSKHEELPLLHPHELGPEPWPSA